MQNSTPKLIAFCGYAGSGKDEASKPLVARGWRRHNMGDIIKRQLDPLIREHLGFSAFTERRCEKARIRGTLEMWGEDNYANIIREYFTDICMMDSPGVVNTRVMRVKEAHLWKDNGGKIYLVENPRARGSSEFEKRCMQELLADATLIDGVVHNDSDLPTFHASIERFFKLPPLNADGAPEIAGGSRSDFEARAATHTPSNAPEGILERSVGNGVAQQHMSPL